MALAGSLEIQLVADVARLRKDLDEVKSSLGGMQQAFEQVGLAIGKVNSLMNLLGVGGGISGLVAFGKHAIDAADHMNDLTKSTGIAIEELAGLGIAAKQSGGDLDGIAASINKLSVNMGKSSDQFKALGITAKDPLEAFKQFADVFSALDDQQQKAALGAAALGKSWASAAPLLAEGGKRIGEMVAEGAKLSKITKELAEESDAFNDKLVLLTGTGGGMNMVLNQMLPLLNKLADDMLTLSKSAETSGTGFNLLLETFKVVVVLGGNVAFVLKTIASDVAATGRQVEALAKGNFREVFRIREAAVEAAAKARTDFDAWEKSIMAVGTAAEVAAQKLGNMDQVSRRAASDGAARAREDAAAAAKAAKAFLDFDANKRNADAAEKARLAELERLRKLDEKSYAEYQAALEKQRGDAADEAKAERDKQRKENEDLLALGVKGEHDAIVARQELHDQEEKTMSDFRLKQKKDDDEARAKELEAVQKQWAEVDAFAFDAFESMFKKGEDTWKHLGESLKKIIIRALYEMTVQKWTLQLFANLTGQTPGAVAGQGGSGVAGSAMSVATGAASLPAAYNQAAAAVAAYFAPTAAATTASITASGAVLTSTALGVESAVAGTATTLAATAAAVVPIVGWVVAAAALIYSLYQSNKEPAQVRGGLGFAGPFEDQAAPTQTPFGNIGFSDAQTQQFSGQVGKAFTDAIGALLTAGAAQLTPEAVDDVTKQMHDTILLSAEGTFTTEEFLQKFGPDMARQLLDPMLAAVDPYAQKLVDSFEGPLQDLLNFAGDLLTVTGALGTRGEEFAAIFGQAIDLQALEGMRKEGESFTATLNRLTAEFTSTNVVAMLMDKTQEEVWGAIGLASEEARAQLIQFAGGVDALNASLGSYYEHYFTAAEKQQMQQQALADSFAKLGVTMPTTLAGFRKLVEAQDLTTEAGRQQYAGLLKLETQLYNFITATDKAETAVSDLAVAVERLPVAVERFGVAAGSTIPYATPGTPGSRDDPAVAARMADAMKTEADLRERLLQLGMSGNEVLERNRELELMKLELLEKEAQMLPGTLTNLQKQINAQEDLNKAADEAAKALSNVAATVSAPGSGPPAEWQFVWTGPGANDGYWENTAGTHSTFPGLPADQGGAADINDQRLQLMLEIFKLVGDKVSEQIVIENQRIIALQKLAPELRGLQRQLWDLQDAAEAAAKALEFMNTKRSLQIQIERALGHEQAALEMEHAAQIEEINKQWGAGTQQATELIALYQQLWGIQGQVGVATDNWIKSLQEWLRSITLDQTLSPLTARQRFDFAQQQYVETLMGAQGGDADARQRFTETANAYLQESLAMFGRASTDYNAIYQAIVAQTEGLIAQGLGPAAPVTMGDLNSTLIQGQKTAAEQMTALLAKVDTLVETTADNGDTVARSVQNIPLPTAPLA